MHTYIPKSDVNTVWMFKILKPWSSCPATTIISRLTVLLSIKMWCFPYRLESGPAVYNSSNDPAVANVVFSLTATIVPNEETVFFKQTYHWRLHSVIKWCPHIWSSLFSFILVMLFSIFPLKEKHVTCFIAEGVLLFSITLEWFMQTAFWRAECSLELCPNVFTALYVNTCIIFNTQEPPLIQSLRGTLIKIHAALYVESKSTTSHKD